MLLNLSRLSWSKSEQICKMPAIIQRTNLSKHHRRRSPKLLAHKERHEHMNSMRIWSMHRLENNVVEEKKATDNMTKLQALRISSPTLLNHQRNSQICHHTKSNPLRSKWSSTDTMMKDLINNSLQMADVPNRVSIDKHHLNTREAFERTLVRNWRLLPIMTWIRMTEDTKKSKTCTPAARRALSKATPEQWASISDRRIRNSNH